MDSLVPKAQEPIEPLSPIKEDTGMLCMSFHVFTRVGAGDVSRNASPRVSAAQPPADFANLPPISMDYTNLAPVAGVDYSFGDASQVQVSSVVTEVVSASPTEATAPAAAATSEASVVVSGEAANVIETTTTTTTTTVLEEGKQKVTTTVTVHRASRPAPQPAQPKRRQRPRPHGAADVHPGARGHQLSAAGALHLP